MPHTPLPEPSPDNILRASPEPGAGISLAPATLTPLWTGDRLTSLCRELGLPRGQPWLHACSPSNELVAQDPSRKWHLYTTEVIAVVQRRIISPTPPPSLEAPPDVVLLHLEMDTPDPSVTEYLDAVVWLMAVRYRTSPVYVERRWHPEYGESFSLRGFTGPGVSLGDIERAWRGWPLLRFLTEYRHLGLRPGGRPAGTGTFESREAFIRMVREAVQSVRASRRYPSQEWVAAYFRGRPGYPACDVRQLRRWCRRFGFASWQEVLAAVG